MNRQSTTQALEEIFEEVLEERIRAADLGYDLEHDVEEGWRHPHDQAHSYHHRVRAMGAPIEKRRDALVKAAALLLATIHTMDTQKERGDLEGS